MMDKETANRNIRLGLMLAIFAGVLFALTFVIAEIVIHS
jgi:hypothetical protein